MTAPWKTILGGTTELVNHFRMYSYRVECSSNTFLTGAAVDDIIKTGGWKTESTP